MRRTWRATLFSNVPAPSAAPRSSLSAIPVTIRPKRFSCGCCAAPARADSRRCIRAMVRSSGRFSIAAATELRGYLAERDFPFVDDETNSDVAIARNRVRAELLPLLEARFNPNIVETLATEADLARDEWLWMTEAAEALRAQTSADGAERWPGGGRARARSTGGRAARARTNARVERDDRRGRRPFDFVRPCCRRAASNQK